MPRQTGGASLTVWLTTPAWGLRDGDLLTERWRAAGRLISMRLAGLLTVALVVSLQSGCGGRGLGPAIDRSGIAGQVHLGPQCPVETADRPCADKPAAGSTVTVAQRLPDDSPAAGQVVARTTTDADGHYRIDVAPGEYVVTASAGMSCELIDVRVHAGAFSTVDIHCDTGIR